MMLRLLFCIAFCALSVVSEQAVPLPAEIKTCKRNTDDYSSCLRLALQESWPVVVAGISELDLLPFDPHFVESLTHNFKYGAVTGKIITRNTHTYGASKARFHSVRVYDKGNEHRLEIDLELPKLFIEGEFKADAAIGTFKIGGKGYYNISMENIRGIVEIAGIVENDRWIIESYNFAPEVEKMKVWADDLFNGNANLTKIALEFINENWRILYTGMLPYVSQVWNPYMKDAMNRIFSKISYAALFP